MDLRLFGIPEMILGIPRAMISLPMDFLQALGKMVLFAIRMGVELVRRPPAYGAVIEQMYHVGVRSLLVLTTVSIFVGSATSVMGYSAFQPLGGQSFLGMLIGLAGMREIAPIIAASLIAAKVGTEMATSLAVMKIKEQLDALEVMGVSPYWYLISPRLVAIGVMLPALTILADFLCLASGFVVAVFQLHTDPGAFWANAFAQLGFMDIVIGIIKGGIFGALIATVSCYYGMNATGGAVGVGRAANRAVVVSAVSVVVVNYILSEIFYG